MKIIQITDLHIYSTDEVINGVDTRANFLNTLKKIQELDYHFLVITGDLCFSDGDIEVYRWIKQKLSEFGIENYYVIGGNHDDVSAIAEVFSLENKLKEDELYYFVEPNFIFLDTVKGYCNENQLEWFGEKMKSIKNTNPIIFMHHPPFRADVYHMDGKYYFKQSSRFEDICKTNDNVSYVFCGHYHNEITLIKDNINMFITPSTYLQIYMYSESFKVDHRIPAFRIIDIEENKVRTTVRYLLE